ncbi:MAG: DNA-formamidopyrimidine glycosylase [Legionellales bacterium]|nr:DNA-formamidopyrimidine glycosylase [Legionellales bacterium]
MPELPEVETTKRGIAAYAKNTLIQQVIVHNPRLRWPVDLTRTKQLAGQIIHSVQRRGKYLLFFCDYLHFIIHLGMSGSLRMTQHDEHIKKHDHIQLVLDNQQTITFNDPRRFGCFIVTPEPLNHKLITKLGVEPLSADFHANYLYKRLQNKKINIKQCIMNSQWLVGVGNIYANEALFLSGIHPLRPANSLSHSECLLLVQQIKQILRTAIRHGGTTLKDFINAQGKPGYFQQTLNVYGRANKPCHHCGNLLHETRINSRSTVFCSVCQHLNINQTPA